jgi:hypothetical protein
MWEDGPHLQLTPGQHSSAWFESVHLGQSFGEIAGGAGDRLVHGVLPLHYSPHLCWEWSCQESNLVRHRAW